MAGAHRLACAPNALVGCWSNSGANSLDTVGPDPPKRRSGLITAVGLAGNMTPVHERPLIRHVPPVLLVLMVGQCLVLRLPYSYMAGETAVNEYAYSC
jgi:hypothetical protein